MPRGLALFPALFDGGVENNAQASRGRGGEDTATISPTRTESSTQSDRNRTAWKRVNPAVNMRTQEGVSAMQEGVRAMVEIEVVGNFRPGYRL
jgi:hypothetical protein